MPEHESQKITPDNKAAYDSNPFTLAFNALGRLFTTNVGWAIALLVVSFFVFIGQMMSNLIQIASKNSLQNSSQYSAPAASTHVASTTPVNVGLVVIIVLVLVLFVALIFTISTAISVFISGMFSYVAIQSEQGKSVNFSEAWSETTKRFWRLFKAQLLAGLKIIGWTMLFIVPGIVAAFRYTLLPFVIMGEPAKERGARSSHTLTKKLVKGRLMEVFGIATVAGIVPFVGPVLRLSGNAALYDQLNEYNTLNKQKPKIHWLNYLGLILLAILLLLITLIIVAIAVAYVHS